MDLLTISRVLKKGRVQQTAGVCIFKVQEKNSGSYTNFFQVGMYTYKYKQYQ